MGNVHRGTLKQSTEDSNEEKLAKTTNTTSSASEIKVETESEAADEDKALLRMVDDLLGQDEGLKPEDPLSTEVQLKEEPLSCRVCGMDIGTREGREEEESQQTCQSCALASAMDSQIEQAML